MKKLFVVMENSFEYNDEVYYSPECGGGYPIKAFKDEKAAQMMALSKNVERLRELGSELRDYAYDATELFEDVEEVEKALGLEAGSLDDWWEIDIPSDLTTEQLEKLAALLKISFFEVMEVEG